MKIWTRFVLGFFIAQSILAAGGANIKNYEIKTEAKNRLQNEIYEEVKNRIIEVFQAGGSFSGCHLKQTQADATSEPENKTEAKPSETSIECKKNELDIVVAKIRLEETGDKSLKKPITSYFKIYLERDDVKAEMEFSWSIPTIKMRGVQRYIKESIKVYHEMLIMLIHDKQDLERELNSVIFLPKGSSESQQVKDQANEENSYSLKPLNVLFEFENGSDLSSLLESQCNSKESDNGKEENPSQKTANEKGGSTDDATKSLAKIVCDVHKSIRLSTDKTTGSADGVELPAVFVYKISPSKENGSQNDFEPINLLVIYYQDLRKIFLVLDSSNFRVENTFNLLSSKFMQYNLANMIYGAANVLKLLLFLKSKTESFPLDFKSQIMSLFEAYFDQYITADGKSPMPDPNPRGKVTQRTESESDVENEVETETKENDATRKRHMDEIIIDKDTCKYSLNFRVHEKDDLIMLNIVYQIPGSITGKKEEVDANTTEPCKDKSYRVFKLAYPNKSHYDIFPFVRIYLKELFALYYPGSGDLKYSFEIDDDKGEKIPLNNFEFFGFPIYEDESFYICEKDPYLATETSSKRRLLLSPMVRKQRRNESHEQLALNVWLGEKIKQVKRLLV